MSNKSVDKKVVNRAAKKVGISRSKKNETLKDQYIVIREDLMKLRDDIAKGYSMTRDWIDKRGNVRDILRAK